MRDVFLIFFMNINIGAYSIFKYPSSVFKLSESIVYESLLNTIVSVHLSYN